MKRLYKSFKAVLLALAFTRFFFEELFYDLDSPGIEFNQSKECGFYWRGAKDALHTYERIVDDRTGILI